MALALAIYGALLSTVLAILTFLKFFAERQTLVASTQISFTESKAFYIFVVSNIGSRPATIIDCHSLNLARLPSGKLAPDWGVEPKRVERLFDDNEPEALDLPITIPPGGTIFLYLDSDMLSSEYADYASHDHIFEAKAKWRPTKKVLLEIVHSLSRSPLNVRFELRENELAQAEKVLARNRGVNSQQ